MSQHVRATLVWLALIAISIASVGISGAAIGVGFSLVMACAAVKAVLIAGEFMELRHMPLAWKVCFGFLIILAFGIIVTIHFLTRN